MSDYVDPAICPECGAETNKFVGECGVCGFNRWVRELEAQR